ncbi:MAG TPA: hypothetical protein VKB17_09055 [Thermoleophilaceae bacterium]|nr:hypothetical protein [Thermoleophilaceae bacterium]
MAKSKKRESAITYARRVADDDYVQAQLRNAVAGLRQAYERASRQRGKAAEDKKLYGHLRESATSIRRAALALQRKRPEPRRRGRKLVLVALAGGGAAVVMSEGGRAKIRAVLSSDSGPKPSDGDAERSASGETGAARSPSQTDTASTSR